MHVTHSQFHPPPRPPCHKAGSSNRLESSPTGWDLGPGQRMWIGYAYLFIFKMCIELFWYWNRIPSLMYTYWGHKSPANSIPYAAPVWGPSLETSLIVLYFHSPLDIAILYYIRGVRGCEMCIRDRWYSSYMDSMRCNSLHHTNRVSCCFQPDSNYHLTRYKPMGYC